MAMYAVVGGGISGLSAAYYLRKLPQVGRVVLLESRGRPGGWIETTRHADGVLHEHGPRTVRPAGPQGANTLLLAEELGLADRVLHVHKMELAARERCVYVDGQLHRLPNSLAALFLTQSPFSRPLVLAGLKDLFTPGKKCLDDSLYNFVSRRFGIEVAEYAVDPMVRGICAGDAREISAASFVAGPLFDLEQEYGGILRGAIGKTLGRKWAPKSKDPDSELERIYIDGGSRLTET